MYIAPLKLPAGWLEFAALILFLKALDFADRVEYASSVNSNLRRLVMSKKTGSQMEAALLDRIEKAKLKLDELQQKHKLEIGILAYKHGLHQFDIKQLEAAFLNLAKGLRHDNA